MHKWKLHEAKNRLSHLVDVAMDGQPQYVTRRGKEVAVIISIEEYQKIKKPKKSFKELLLSFPQCEDFDVERVNCSARDFDL